MTEPSTPPASFFKIACYLELSLILVAFLLGWIADINPLQHFIINESALLNGLFATLPLCLIFAALNLLNYPAIKKMRELLHTLMAKDLNKCHWTDLLVLAMIAGVSEELLFRGVILPWMENAWGLNLGLLFSSLLFGLFHTLTPLYFILTTCASLYLGLCLDYGETRNLFTPIIVHGFYDFFAFNLILRSYRLAQQRTPPNDI